MTQRDERFFPYEAAITRDPLGLDIQYSIPFEGGSLYVSEEAHDRYGLLPMTSTEAGYIPKSRDTSTGPPVLRLFLLAPGELDVPLLLHPQQIFHEDKVDEAGVESQIAFGSDKADMKSTFAAQIDAFARMASGEGESEHVEVEICDERGPIDRDLILERWVTQQYVGGICVSLAHALPPALLSWRRYQESVNYGKKLKGFNLRGVRNSLRAQPNHVNKDEYRLTQFAQYWGQTAVDAFIDAFTMRKLEGEFPSIF